jgi:hypothetical protein
VDAASVPVLEEGGMSSSGSRMLDPPIQARPISRDQSTRRSSRFVLNEGQALSGERIGPAWGDIGIEIRAGFGIHTPFADGGAD